MQGAIAYAGRTAELVPSGNVKRFGWHIAAGLGYGVAGGGFRVRGCWGGGAFRGAHASCVLVSASSGNGLFQIVESGIAHESGMDAGGKSAKAGRLCRHAGCVRSPERAASVSLERISAAKSTPAFRWNESRRRDRRRGIFAAVAGMGIASGVFPLCYDYLEIRR